MGLIYKNASCNIAASWAKDGSYGCFNTRDPALIAPATIELNTSLTDAGVIETFDIVEYWKWDKNIRLAPLNGRGWVAQERFLAPRQLSFTEHEVYWECSQLVSSEQLPDGIPEIAVNLEVSSNKALSAKPRVNYEDTQLLRRVWVLLVSTFTRSKLTYYSDKMIAIAGLVAELRESLNDEYLAGMWRKDLHKQLCWYVVVRELDRDSWYPKHPRAQHYIATMQTIQFSSVRPSNCVELLEVKVR